MWENLSDDLTLEYEYIHLWYFNLDILESEIKFLEQNLSEDELIRANKYKFEYLQNRFIVARSILRIILGKYLDIKPSNLIFKYSNKGKPVLAKNLNYLSIDFNVSHSENIALYAFTINHQIGVDIEHIRPIANLDKLAERFFHPREYKLIRVLEPDKKQKMFFKIWTAKESYLKAVGEGIAGGLDKIEIDNCALKINNVFLKKWHLYEIETKLQYCASLAVNSDIRLPIIYKNQL